MAMVHRMVVIIVTIPLLRKMDAAKRQERLTLRLLMQRVALTFGMMSLRVVQHWVQVLRLQLQRSPPRLLTTLRKKAAFRLQQGQRFQTMVLQELMIGSLPHKFLLMLCKVLP